MNKKVAVEVCLKRVSPIIQHVGAKSRGSSLAKSQGLHCLQLRYPYDSRCGE